MIAQQQSQKQQFKILPQQIQLLNLYFLNSLELQQRIKNELEENLFLDTIEEKEIVEDVKLAKDGVQDFWDGEETIHDDRPDYKLEHQNYFDSEVSPNYAIRSTTTYKEDAKEQLGLLDISIENKITAEYLIDMLNAQGFMDRSLNELVDDMSFHFQKAIDANTIKEGLTIIQSLDPIGIGTCDIRECLLLQLHAMTNTKPEIKLTIIILEKYYTDLIHRQFDKLTHALKIDDSKLKLVLSVISKLKFYPVKEISQYDPKNTIMPDFVITNDVDKIQVNLLSGRSASVFVNQSLYDELACQINNKDKTASQYVKNKLSSAQWFCDAVRQRESTMLSIMRCIVQIQHDYFIDGDIRLLKPMVLRNVSDISGYDISTISRITSNKYAETHFGMLYLKKLFSEGIADKKGEVISSKVIQSEIGDTIHSEDKKHPFTDEQIVKLLTGRGYNIARRTISKYRKNMHIPVAQIRAVWA